MTFSRTTILVLAASLLIMPGCQKPQQPGSGTEQGGGTTKPSGPYFKADIPDEIVMNYDQGDCAAIKVDTNIPDWTVTASESWCTATIKTEEFWLNVEDYDCRDENGYERYDPPRTCTVTVKAGTVYSKTIKVVQQTHTIISFTQRTYSQNYDWILDEPSGMKVLLSADGQTRDVMITSNAYRWIPTTEASWLKVECVDNATLRVTSTARGESETAARSATVKLYVETDQLNYATFTVEDAPANVEGNDFHYGDHTDWD